MSNKKAFNRVLIIDDDHTSVYLTKLTLEDMEIAGQILTAKNGQEGLDRIKQYCLNEQAALVECPDLILLDINMPIMNGFDVVHALKLIGQDHLIRAKVVILTTSANPTEVEKMRALGVKDYLEKPVSEDKILPFINETK
ncbi:response regulator [Rhodocytophaga aerolata]|uniref:Response regulator n=1 Tax=Rhodocytophaga aerolata TaxID=455078 RepID=A0ABT8RC98_9BACT|nr:response regulator [Rhodocytophaga aerolata]MDO1449732.1 response regulator [Rhodocytophaga aerolata]